MSIPTSADSRAVGGGQRGPAAGALVAAVVVAIAAPRGDIATLRRRRAIAAAAEGGAPSPSLLEVFSSPSPLTFALGAPLASSTSGGIATCGRRRTRPPHHCAATAAAEDGPSSTSATMPPLKVPASGLTEGLLALFGCAPRGAKAGVADTETDTEAFEGEAAALIGAPIDNEEPTAPTAPLTPTPAPTTPPPKSLSVRPSTNPSRLERRAPSASNASM